MNRVDRVFVTFLSAAIFLIAALLLWVTVLRPSPSDGVSDAELRRLCDDIKTEVHIAHKQFTLLGLDEQRAHRVEHVALLSEALNALKHCPR